MARLVAYKPSFRGIKIVRSSRGVDRHLEQRARRMATAAEAVYAALGHEVSVDVLQDRSDTKEPRARVAVIARHPAALRIEAKHRVLGGSLDAAR